MFELSVLLLCSVSLVIGQGKSAAARAVKRAYVDEATGQIHIVYSDAQDVQIPKEKDQVSSETPVIAPDQETVAWPVEVPNCCTSYPIPTTLVIYKSGRIIRRIGDGLMIYKWQFLANGRRVAISSGTVHGMNGIHLTLYESQTGKRLKAWDGENDDVPPNWGTNLAR